MCRSTMYVKITEVYVADDIKVTFIRGIYSLNFNACVYYLAFIHERVKYLIQTGSGIVLT